MLFALKELLPVLQFKPYSDKMMLNDFGMLHLILESALSQLHKVWLTLLHADSIISTFPKFLFIYLNKRSRGGKGGILK